MASRGGFNSKIGFILAAAGSAVGLGNIWQFPFEVQAGGGAAFVFIYLAFSFILCFPVMVTEIAIGRKTQKNPVGAFKELGYKKWSIIGLMGVISGVLILSFYNVVAGWAFGYFLEMIQGNFGIGDRFTQFTSSEIGRVSLYGIIFMGMTAFIVSKGISGGIEKAAKFLMPTLLIMIIGLTIYGLTLDHAFEGVKFYLVPDFSKVTGSVIYNAMGQAFFSLSLGMGALITYGSYVDRKENIVSSAAYITLADVGIAFCAGLLMFPLVSFMNAGNMDNVQGGAGLIFATLPGVFETFTGPGGVIIGSLFFLLLCFAALTSTVSLLEVPVSYVVDEFKVQRKTTVWIIAIVIFIIGIPSLLSKGASDFFSTSFITYDGGSMNTDFMNFIQKLANDTFLPFGGCLITFFGAWIWKKKNLNEELAQGYPGYRGSFVEKYINFAVGFLAPAVLAVVFVLIVLSSFFDINVV
ncbi:MAG: sodium-dependent transporter [Bacteroidota bacterium]